MENTRNVFDLRVIDLFYEIWVTESNVDGRIIIGSSEIAVSAYEQLKCGKKILVNADKRQNIRIPEKKSGSSNPIEIVEVEVLNLYKLVHYGPHN